MSMELSKLTHELFPTTSPELQTLFAGAIANAAVLHADFMTIRDLVELSGYQNHESLHALLLILFLALEEGSLCVEISPEGLRRRLANVVEEREGEFWARQILGDLERHVFPNLIGQSPSDSKPVLRFVSGDTAYLYFHKYLRGELLFHEELHKRLQAPAACARDWSPILREVLVERPLQVADRKLRLDRDQLVALGLALVRNFLIISGGPGTGKTSLVMSLLRCLVRGGLKPEQIALAAPTGRAAQRLADSLRLGLDRIAPAPAEPDLLLHQLKAGTLHQLLDYSPTRGIFRRHAENPLPAEVVLVDEVSMVGVVLMAQLFQALKPETKLVLLGDKDQLPSVEAGAVLAGLVPSDTPNRYSPATWQTLRKLFPDSPLEEPPIISRASQGRERGEGVWPEHVVVLQVNHRSQTDIRDAAAAVNRQAPDLAERLPAAKLTTAEDCQELQRRGGCWLLEQNSTQPAELRRVLQLWANHHYLGSFAGLVQDCPLQSGSEENDAVKEKLQTLFQLLESSRILTLVREGAWGCVGINRFLDAHLRPHLARSARGHLFTGAPVLITANDHARQLFNGDVGLTLPGADGPRVVFQRRGGFFSIAPESLPPHELGFALTVHKSQGSEYDSVLLVLPPTGGRRLLTKEILYTGMTRARNLALLCGSREVLQLAVSRRIMRESALDMTHIKRE